MKLFVVDYQFLSCGAVFTDGLAHAAVALGVDYQHALWNDGDLMGRIAAFQPDLLFVTHGRRFCRQYKGQFSQYRSAVWLLDEPYEVDDTASFAKEFGTIFVCDQGTLHRHRNAHYLPVCADPVIYHHGTEPRNQAVGFIGGANTARNEYLAALAEAGLLTYVIGGPFADPRVQRLSRGHNIPAVQTADWYRRTRLIVNVFRVEHHWNRENIPATSMNPRVYEATACGALVVSEWRPEIEQRVPELPTFRSVQSCVDQVAYWSEHDWQAQQALCAKRLANDTYTKRLRTVLQQTGLLEAAA